MATTNDLGRIQFLNMDSERDIKEIALKIKNGTFMIYFKNTRWIEFPGWKSQLWNEINDVQKFGEARREEIFS